MPSNIGAGPVLQVARMSNLIAFDQWSFVISNSDIIQLFVFSLGIAAVHKEQSKHKLESDKKAIAARIANQTKTRFIDRMSYLVRTPMNAVIGSIELLNRSSLTEEQKKYVATMRYEVPNREGQPYGAVN